MMVCCWKFRLNRVVRDPTGDSDGPMDDLDGDYLLADLVAAQERELYGYDGSIPRRPTPLFVDEEPEMGTFSHSEEDDMSDRSDAFSQDECRSYYELLLWLGSPTVWDFSPMCL
ncbi:hypothetical protein JAAARDRAFT_543323 [Jaapia argillacea MUCL 33604]|uniref:Uncharacterized protein n=1 Tax=Jaapia argillacea MUCL 33604 TaxID=933084 RepID=A0A067P7W1_9AGAM|nr:hypothetical protein JAAARDRAFT_543323 [Jaapia argillacea MUCL 33604]